jgi:hypothetical protein
VKPQTNIGAQSPGGHALLIRVNNTADVVSQQGALAQLAQTLAPMTIEGQMYSTLASRLKSALADQGVDASTTVVDPAGYKPATSDVLRDVAIGVLGAGVFAGLAYLFKRGRK